MLVLGWNGSYGDTVASQKVTVKEIDPFSDFRVDSFYTIYDPGPSTTTVLGTKTFSPQNLKDSVKVFQDTTAGQLRIRLDNSFGKDYWIMIPPMLINQILYLILISKVLQ